MPAQRRTGSFSIRARHSALSPAQQRIWERRWPELGLDRRPAAPPAPEEPLDLHRWFGRTAPRVLEIGCGTGVSTLAMAQVEPQVDVVAVEVYQRGLAQLLAGIDRADVANIRLIQGDGLDVLENLVGSESLIGVRVFFPDPWPKARHHKRRLLQPSTLALIADRLQPGGVLHAATDHADYAEQIAEVGDAEPRLRRVAPGAALPISVARPTTKYEARAHRLGSAITELIWERRS